MRRVPWGSVVPGSPGALKISLGPAHVVVLGTALSFVVSEHATASEKYWDKVVGW